MLPTLVLLSLAAGAAAELSPGAAALASEVPGAGGAAPGRLAPTLPLAPPRVEDRGGVLRQEEEWDQPRYEDDEDVRRPHLLLSGWGGEALAHGGSGRSSSFYGGEVAWAFSSLDLGLAGSWYRTLRDATRTWTPVVLTRVTQRFTTRRGFEAAFSLGFGAGRPSSWIGWYQVALGLRIPIGPLFLGGELAFEQYDIIRLGAGLGVGF